MTTRPKLQAIERPPELRPAPDDPAEHLRLSFHRCTSRRPTAHQIAWASAADDPLAAPVSRG